MTTTNKIITGGAIAGAIITGAIIADQTTDYAKPHEPKAEIQKEVKREKEIISHSEFIERIRRYNIEILEVNSAGFKFKLENINANNTIIDALNRRITTFNR